MQRKSVADRPPDHWNASFGMQSNQNVTGTRHNGQKINNKKWCKHSPSLLDLSGIASTLPISGEKRSPCSLHIHNSYLPGGRDQTIYRTVLLVRQFSVRRHRSASLDIQLQIHWLVGIDFILYNWLILFYNGIDFGGVRHHDGVQFRKSIIWLQISQLLVES